MTAKAVCILGMHRSGTSAVSRAINLLGVYLGKDEDIFFPAEDNPEGFWEHLDLVKCHEALLQYLHRSWDTVQPIPEDFFESKDSEPFRRQLKELVRKNFGSKELWGWKDPRTALFLPLWLQVLKEMDIPLCAVFVVRNPVDVAASLLKRNDIPLDKSIAVWFNYNISALRQLYKIPVAFLSYDNLLADATSEIRKCAAKLQIPWPNDEKLYVEELNRFLKPSLRHSQSGIDSLSHAPVFAKRLYEILISNNDNLQEYSEEIEQLYSEYNEYGKCYSMDMEKCWEYRQQNVQCMETIKNLEGQLLQLTKCNTVSNKLKSVVTKYFRWLH